MWDQRSSKGHLGLLTFRLKFLKKMVSNVFSWDLDNDPWVNSHISPLQVWGQI